MRLHKQKVPLSDDKRISKAANLLREYASEGTKYYKAKQRLIRRGFTEAQVNHASYMISYGSVLKKNETKPTKEILKKHFRSNPEDVAIFESAKYKSMEETQDDLDSLARFFVRLVFRTPLLSHLSLPVQTITQLITYSIGDQGVYRKYREAIVVSSIFCIIFGFIIFVVVPLSTVGGFSWW